MAKERAYVWSLVGALACGLLSLHFFLRHGDVDGTAFRQSFAAFALFVAATALSVWARPAPRSVPVESLRERRRLRGRATVEEGWRLRVPGDGRGRR